MRECRTPDVPTFSVLRKKQAELTRDVKIQTIQHVSAMGNEFYMNHPAELLALDWANPLVREFIQVYPEITDRISELNHADKWTKEVDLDDLSPMWADWSKSAHKHFYIKELAQLQNGKFVIPMRWVIFKKEEYAEVYNVVHYPEVCTSIVEIALLFMVLQSDCFVIHDEEITGYSLKFPDSSPSWAQNMPNPVRKIAKGRPVFSVRIIPWSDDVSGNVSKQYNPHVNIYMANANLPHRKVSQEYFVRFCSTSPHASSGEQFEALSEDLGSDKYHDAYDCKLEQDILFRIFAHVLPADNPQQAESASNAGVHSNLWCRYDMAGGTAAHRETDEGYRALFKPGIPRTPAQTVRVIKQQIWAACSGVQDAVDELQTSTGVKDKTALFWIEKLIVKARETQKERFNADPRLKDRNLKGDARKAVKTRIRDLIQWELYNWVILQPEDRAAKLPKDSAEHHQLRPGDHYNILLRVRGLDPHRDSPCEILHSILLGDDKYIWRETNTPWDKSKGDKFAVRLQSSSTNGLNLASVRGRYIVKYKNGLIGKHFKILQQLGIFHLHDDLCSNNLFNLWKASGELGALLWYPEIRNLEQYLADLQICIDNVLDLWAVIDPARIVTKYKLHVLPHLPDDIRRFGPAILYAMLERNIPALQYIGVTLADMERFKHQASGGWWKPEGSQDYVQAGHEVTSFLQKNKELQRRLGWMDKSKPKSGSIKLDSCRTAVSAPWRDVLGPLWAPELDIGAGKTWITCKYVVSQAGDVCTKDSWVFFKCKETGEVLSGRICLILIPSAAPTKFEDAVVVLRKFDVSATRDVRMNMPVLSSSPEIHLVAPAAILFFFNAQHDCYGSKCRAISGLEHVIQERNLTSRTQTAVQHENTQVYFINMHALHNAHLLRDTLPRNLTAPIPCFPDRDTKRDEFAALLRVSGPAKRAATAKKSRETREKKKQAKAAAEKGPELGDPEEDEEDEEDEGLSRPDMMQE
ncbi:hypothetical protein B0H10DRAFT_2174002 [Mycena sp. CBHHK59/15]|nr:hypothetical protein B0H10DRAFT_2174002 [Mycena sp. CBHHK59/15]